jgi:hypothetical protein
MTREEAIRQEAARLGLGATGAYPHGRMGPHDEGELKTAIGIVDNRIVINFGKSVEWLSLTSVEALRLARLLVTLSATLDGKE